MSNSMEKLARVKAQDCTNARSLTMTMRAILVSQDVMWSGVAGCIDAETL